jgi:arginine exporter protein ArgO
MSFLRVVLYQRTPAGGVGTTLLSVSEHPQSSELVQTSDPGLIQWLSKGLLIGFSIAAPVGPIGVLCIRRYLAEGRQIGLYLSTLVLTLTNPMTILSFVAVFAGIGFGTSAGYRNAGVLVAGVSAGSALWWVLLSNGAASFRTRVTDGWMRMVNRISGLIILGFGVYALITVFSK